MNVEVMGQPSLAFDHARNVCLQKARDCKVDWNVQLDNDVFPLRNPLDILDAAGDKKHVIGVPYGTYTSPHDFAIYPHMNHSQQSGEFQEEEHVAGGILMIRDAVWNALPKGPWFRWQHADDETLSQNGGHGEDVSFCKLCRANGIRVWSHKSLAGHYRTIDLTQMVCNLANLTQRAQIASQANRWVTPPR